MCVINTVLIVCLLIVASKAQNKTQDLFGYPEVEENENFKNKENRQPVYLPNICPESELYYPGDQKDDWICDCRPAYLYHPSTDRCWPAYRKGPCAEKEYLVLPENSVIPICTTNPCDLDGYVQWKGKCERLGSTIPCNNMFPAALWINATTLEINCEKIIFSVRFGNEVPVSVGSICPPGCRRRINRKCVVVS